MKILQDILVPHESVNDRSLTVIALLFKTGDFVKKGDILIELETSKAIINLEADVDGHIIYYCKVDDELPLNTLIIQITDTKTEIGAIKPTKTKSAVSTQDKPEAITYETQFSKKALAALKKNNLSKEVFKNYDFVTEDIIHNYLNPSKQQLSASELTPKKNITDQPVKRSKEFLSKVSLEKLPSAKRREIEYLSSVQSGGLISTLHIDIDTTGLIDSVSSQFAYFKDSILPLVVFETAKLLLKYPLLNAFYENGQVGKYLNVNVGLAIDIDDGLKVVKLPNTAQLTIFEIEEEIFKLSNKYLDKELSVADFTDITFTITDLSAFETYFFMPLVNKDNSAILGISGINNKLNQCILSIAFDHRVTSGKYVGSFLSELKSRIESYAINDTVAVSTLHLECYKCLKNISEDANDIGFIKVQTKSGEEKLICDSCLLMY